MKALAALLLLASSVQAGVVVDNYDLATNPTALLQFNPALGTLTGVELQFKDVEIFANSDISLPQLDGVGKEILQNQAHIIAPGILATEPLNSFVFRSSVDLVDHTTNFGLPSSFSLFPVAIASYIGIGTVPFGLTSSPALQFASPPPGLIPASDTDSTVGELKVIYTFNEGAVPEPQTFAMAFVGIACCAGGFWYRRHGRSC